MAKLIAHNPPRVKLKASGFIGSPTGETEITENGTYNVKPYATAKVKVPVKIQVDSNSILPLYFGVNSSGFCFSNDPSIETNVFLGLDSDGHPYATNGGDANE